MVSTVEFTAYKTYIEQKFETANVEWKKASDNLTSINTALSQQVSTNIQNMEAAYAGITVLENDAKRMHEETNGRRGIERMFDGKNPKLVPSVFAQEKEGSKNFKTWSSSIKTFMELADTEASEILKKALQPCGEDEELNWYYKGRYIYGLLMSLTDGEAHEIVESSAGDGVVAWRKLHDRWHKAQKQSSTAIAEKIRSIGKAKSLDEVNSKMTELQTLYNDYYDVRNEQYGEIERKADILRIVPLALQQRLQLDIEDIDKEPIQTLHNKVQNYIRNKSNGTAKLDISAVEEEGKKEAQQDYKPQEEEYQEEEQYSEDLSYMGSKGKGKGKGKGIKGKCWNRTATN